jgi:hypothetical protein
MGEIQDFPIFTPTESLAKTQEILDPLKSETIVASSWPEAHNKLGLMHKKQIQEILKESKDDDPKQFKKDLKFTQECEQFMRSHAKGLENTNPELTNAVNTYLECVTEWSNGAGITPTEGLYLQNDGVGCQSMFIRGQDGSIYFGHSEEMADEGSVDLEVRPFSPNWITFEINGQKNHQAFSPYPELLPGVASGMSDSRFFCADVLIPKESDSKPGFFANTALWLTWYLGKSQPFENIVQQLPNILGGYSLNILENSDSGPTLESVEFMNGIINIQELGREPGSTIARRNDASGQELQAEQDLGEDKGYFTALKTAQERILEAISTRLKRKNFNIPPKLDSIKKIFGFTGTPPERQQNEHTQVIMGIAKPCDIAVFAGELNPSGEFSTSLTLGPIVHKDKSIQELKLSGRDILT